jgi:hypothetical protein
MTSLVSFSSALPGGQFSLEHTERLYNQSLRTLYQALETGAARHIDPTTISLVSDLIEYTKRYDIQQACQMTTELFAGHLPRDLDTPPSYAHPHLNGQIWADDPNQPLKPGEQWNAGRRAMNIDERYALDQNGLPVNPYLNFGVKGRGIVGRFGPNHAVDNGVLRIMPDENGKLALHALGIIRQDDGKPALCGGFSNFTRLPDGSYNYGHAETVQTQTQEFVEELVSGSVALLPDYAEGLDADIAHHIAVRTRAEGAELNVQQQNVIRNELVTQRRLQQISERDPAFLERIGKAFDTATPCYAGPVLASSRNTNTAWMETRLSWIMLNETDWITIKGDDPFNYDFVAGDDAQQVLWHRIDPKLVKHSTASHGALFSYLLNSYLLTKEQKDDTVLKQAQDLLMFFKNETRDTPAPQAVPA